MRLLLILMCVYGELLVHYKFWTSFGQVFYDFSGHGNHAFAGTSSTVESNDPVATPRGVYVTGSMPITLPPNDAVQVGLLTGKQFSFTMWYRSGSFTFTLFQKTNNADRLVQVTQFDWFYDISIGEKLESYGTSCENYYGYLGTDWRYVALSFDFSVAVPIVTLLNDYGYCGSFGSTFDYIDDPTLPITLGQWSYGYIFEFRLYNHLLTYEDVRLMYTYDGGDWCICIQRCALFSSPQCTGDCWDPLTTDDCKSCQCGGSSCLSAPTTCAVCHSTCKLASCTGLTFRDCAVGQNCHATCKVCSGAKEADCEVCFDFADLESAAPSKCVCSEGFFPSNTAATCKACHTMCAKCASEAATGCLSCKRGSTLEGKAPSACKCNLGSYLSGLECSPCAEGCSSCEDASACAVCQANAVLVDSVCQCLSGFFKSGGSCLQCPPGCESCDEQQCFKCSLGLIASGTECVRECPLGYKASDSGACEPGDITPPAASVSVNSDNSLVVTFDKEMKCELTADSVSIAVVDASGSSVEVSWSAPSCEDSVTMLIALRFGVDRLSAGSSATLEFLDPRNITDAYGVPITQAVFYVALNAFGEEGTETTTTAVLLQGSAAQAAAAASKGGVSASVATSFINGSPVGLISLVNQLQLVTYLAMTKLPLPADFASSLAALNVGSMIPNPLSKYATINDTDHETPQYIRDYGIESTLFVTNSISFLGTCVAILSSYGPIYLLSKSKVEFIANYFRAMLPSFKWGIPIKLWLTSYLDLGIYSLLELRYSYNSFSSASSGCSTVIAAFVSLPFAITPVLIAAFVIRNFNYISSRSDPQFNLRYGALFLDLKEGTSVATALYFALFTVRRLSLALALIFADDFPVLFASLNCFLCVVSLIHVVGVRPFAGKLNQMEAVAMELCTVVLYFSASGFLFNLSDMAVSGLTWTGVWTIRVSIGLNVLISVVRSGVSVVTLLKLYRARMRAVKAKYQVREVENAGWIEENNSAIVTEASPYPVMQEAPLG